MSQLLPSLVTLVVKAPNQKIDDQKIECSSDWTVKELKQHLSKVYPTNPTENQQRIIYSGQLLQDNQRLKDVLKQYDPEQNVHIIHLVCSASMSQYPSVSSPSSNVQSPDDTSSDGIRRRHPFGEQNADAAATGAFSSMSYPPVYGPHSGMMYYYHTMNAAMVPPTASPAVAGYVPYTAQQWMQQAYAQSMMQYMQQYHQSVPQPHAAPPVASPVIPAPPINQNFPNEFPGGAAIDPEVPIQPIGMNAHGGRDDNDDDIDQANRDWLDRTYTAVRLMMLMSLLFFYSTPQRFLVACTVALMFYVYRVGWRLRRARVNARNPVPAPNGREQRNEQAPEAHQDERSEDSEPEVTMIDLQATHRPSTLQLIWSVVSSFFASLVPDNPAPININ